MMQARARESPQPQLAACSSPKTLSPIPAAINNAPRRSILSFRPCVAMPASRVSTSAVMATGILIQKIARQVHWVR